MKRTKRLGCFFGVSSPHKLGLLISREAYFPGSDFIIATAINDDGVIVGLYFDKQGVSHGFKALPKDKQ